MPVAEALAAYLRTREPGEAVLNALNELLAGDAHLLEADANERSISHRFAMYLQGGLPGWHVDCEYNRDGEVPKRVRLLGPSPSAADTDATTVFPDVIAHRRNTKDNYLVVEIKKSTSSVSEELDYMKLRGYKEDLGYRFALFVRFSTGGQIGVASAEWI
jgi:hypothetical protein